MRSIALIASVIVVLTSCAAPAPPAANPAVEQAAVERAITQWYDSGVAVGDTAVMKRGLTPTFAILVDSVWYDKAGIIQYISSLPSLVGGPFTWRYAFSDWRTAVHGDVAWTSFRDRAVLTPQKGAPVSFDWWETVVLTKVDGAWLIDRYQSASVRK
jgi:hypothetical protein